MSEFNNDSPQDPTVIKKPQRRMKVHVSVHDRTQLETAFTYYFNRVQTKKWRTKKTSSYKVDAYFFFPPQMRINPQTYPKEQFYHDLRVFIRLREPKLSYKDLMAVDDQMGASSPIVFLRQYLDSLKHGTPAVGVERAIEEVKIFACTYQSYFMRRIGRRRKNFNIIKKQLTKNPGDQSIFDVFTQYVDDAENLLQKAYTVLSEYRVIVAGSESLSDQHKAFCAKLKMVDEYCSYVFWDGIFSLNKLIDDSQTILPKAMMNRLKVTLINLVNREQRYAQSTNYFWISELADEQVKEQFVYRKGCLKKHLWKVLYLDVRDQPMQSFQQQVGAMAAAAIAAGWATFASILIWTSASFQGFGGLRELSGVSLFLIVTAFVMAYVLKDRIKELGRSYFRGRLFKNLPDNSNKIFYHDLSGSQITIGTVYESTHFVEAGKLPTKIAELHHKSISQDFDENELFSDIIHYCKVIKINEDFKPLEIRNFAGVQDIIRLNVESFLPRLDDPVIKLTTINQTGQSVLIELPKVYFLDVILKYSPTGKSRGEQETYDQIRLVITKNGLARIEYLN